MKKLVIILSMAFAFACNQEHRSEYTGLPTVKQDQAGFEVNSTQISFKSEIDLRSFANLVNNKIRQLGNSGSEDIFTEFINDTILPIYTQVDFSPLNDYPELLDVANLPMEEWPPELISMAAEFIQNQGIEVPPAPCPADDVLETLPCTEAYDNSMTIAFLNYVAGMIKACADAAYNPVLGFAEAIAASIGYYTAYLAASAQWCSCMYSTYGSVAPGC
jgi:hypothetical protein